MLKTHFQLSVLDGVDFYFSQDSESIFDSGSNDARCSCSDPFTLCLRSQKMLDIDWENAECI